MKKEEFYYDSRDGHSKTHAVRYIPEETRPRCILQIVHGMAEHIGRYEEFASFMAERGILVTGEDHLGHGLSLGEDGIKGYFCKKDPATVVVRDVHRLKKLTQDAYPGIPYIIFGHSMGSFITRNYICTYGRGVDAAIIMGTGMHPKGLLRLSKGITGIQKLFLGSKHTSKLLDSLVFGSFGKRIKTPRTEFDYLTKDENIVDQYIKDSLCGFKFTVNGFQTLFELIYRLTKKENLNRIPKELPVFMLSGKEDPVGNYGEGVKMAYESMTKIGVSNIELKLYENDRHELLNETDKKVVMNDMYQFIDKVLKNMGKE